MLNAIAETSQFILSKIDSIQKLKEATLVQVKSILKASFNREVVDVIFSFPYVKIKTLENHGIAKRQTASTFLQQLAKAGILQPLKVKKEMYYINVKLMEIISKSLAR